jgi:hypothetical protein
MRGYKIHFLCHKHSVMTDRTAVCHDGESGRLLRTALHNLYSISIHEACANKQNSALSHVSITSAGYTTSVYCYVTRKHSTFHTFSIAFLGQHHTRFTALLRTKQHPKTDWRSTRDQHFWDVTRGLLTTANTFLPTNRNTWITLYISLTTWSRYLPQKLTGPKVITKFPAF